MVSGLKAFAASWFAAKIAKTTHKKAESSGLGFL
jgi:hypothetical protein